MPNSKALFQELVSRISLPEEKEEIQSIVYLILEHQFGLSRTDIMASKEIKEIDQNRLTEIISRINQHEPIQYIFGEAYFFGRSFKVSPSVLIPRPETEQLISEVLKLKTSSSIKILDIGTGSGCIGITLALEIAQSKVFVSDISDGALSVAKENAHRLEVSIYLLKHDILTEEIPEQGFDFIVSNPPYISTEEKAQMRKNVLDYEPHLALFAEQDPLLFYKHIAAKAKSSLNKEGKVVVEINEHFGRETVAIFKSAGFSNCTVIRDLQHKERIIVAY